MCPATPTSPGTAAKNMTDYTDSQEAIAFTRVPNALIDHAMRELGNAAFRVLVVVARKTIGWAKQRDQISLSQFEELTGLARQHVIRGIAEARERGFIAHYRSGQHSFFELTLDAGISQLQNVTSNEKLLVLVTKSNQTSNEKLPELVTKSYPQKKERKKKERKETLTRANARVAPSQHPNINHDSAESPMDNYKDKPKTTKRESTPYGDLFIKIANVCHIDPKIGKHAKQISSTAKYLEARGVTPDRVDAFATWWSANDFRGKRGEYPYPSVIAESWLRFEESSTPTPSAPSPQSRYATTTTSKSGTFRRGQAMFTDEQRAAAEEKARRELEEEGDDLPITGKTRIAK